MIITTSNIPDAERTLLCLVNVYRSSTGVPTLTEDPHLEAAAQGHSEYMESTNTFGHDDVGDGTSTSRANHGATGTQNFAIVSNGATDTASDLLTSPKCDDAQDVAAALAKRLEKDQKRLDATKKGTDHRKRAKAKVRKDKKKADAAAADADKACDLTY